MSNEPLVNAHTHLELTWAAHLCPEPPGMPMPAWLAQLDKHWGGLPSVADERRRTETAVINGITQLLAAGTTHVGDISNTGLSIEPLLDSGLAGVVYIEVWGLKREAALERFYWARQLLEKHRPAERNGLQIGLTLHTPYTVHPDVLQMVARYAQQEAVPLCIHVAESPFENDALVHGRGPTYEFLRLLGPVPRPGFRSVAYLDKLGVLAAKPLLAHVVNVNDDELTILAQSGAKVVHCPRSNSLLQCGRMPLEKMLALGIPIALGTDSLASSPSLDVREEATTAVSLHHPHLTPVQIMPLLCNTSVISKQ